jgi:hypothetical protein
MPWIEIIVSPAGHSQVQTKGFEGASCRAGSQFIERALGQTTSEHLTSEFHEIPVSQQTSETEHS